MLSLAQGPPPPPDPTVGGRKGTSTNKGPAPIDGGLAVAVALIAGYGAWKVYSAARMRREAACN